MTSVLLHVDACSAEARTVGSTGWSIEGLAHDPVGLRNWGITAAGHVLQVDQDTGETTYLDRVSAPNGQETRCLLYNSDRDTLFTFAVDPAPGGNDSLLEISLQGSLIMDVGPVVSDGGDFEAMAAYNFNMGVPVMYAVLNRGPGMDSLLFKFTADGLINQTHVLTGFDKISALTYDASTTGDAFSYFYAADTAGDQLVRIDVFNGTTLVIGPTVETRALNWLAP